MKSKKHIAIFASGGGSNAEVIMKYFKEHEKINVSLIVTNNPQAGVIEKAEKHNVPVYIGKNEDFNTTAFLELLNKLQVDFIILAGYLKKIPTLLLENFHNKIINIHPALLPKFGGKGMYGMNVHKAVVEAKEKRSGMTIHLVNEHYDEGAVIEQHEVEINSSDNAETVAKKVLELEHKYFAPCIEKVILYGI